MKKLSIRSKAEILSHKILSSGELELYTSCNKVFVMIDISKLDVIKFSKNENDMTDIEQSENVWYFPLYSFINNKCDIDIDDEAEIELFEKLSKLNLLEFLKEFYDIMLNDIMLILKTSEPKSKSHMIKTVDNTWWQLKSIASLNGIKMGEALQLVLNVYTQQLLTIKKH